MAPQTLLQLLQTSTVVDCDMMDYEGRIFPTDEYLCADEITVAKYLGPFVDCTSNQVRIHGSKQLKKK